NALRVQTLCKTPPNVAPALRPSLNFSRGSPQTTDFHSALLTVVRVSYTATGRYFEASTAKHPLISGLWTAFRDRWRYSYSGGVRQLVFGDFMDQIIAGGGVLRFLLPKIKTGPGRPK